MYGREFTSTGFDEKVPSPLCMHPTLEVGLQGLDGAGPSDSSFITPLDRISFSEELW